MAIGSRVFSHPTAAPPLFSPAFLRDPYPTYRQHRDGPRVQPLEIRPNLYGVFRYADCATLYRDPRLTAERPREFWVNTDCPDLTQFDDLIDHMQR
jgi:cytochrome P450